MNQEDIYRRVESFSRQSIHIIVSSKLQFQRVIRRVVGPSRLAAINASVNPFILPLIRYDLSFDVYIFVLL